MTMITITPNSNQNPPPLLLGDKPQGQFTQLGGGQNQPNLPGVVNFGEEPIIINIQGKMGQVQQNQGGQVQQNQGGQKQGNIGTEIKESLNTLIGMLQNLGGGDKGNGGENGGEVKEAQGPSGLLGLLKHKLDLVFGLLGTGVEGTK
ncbi:hypothetical protein AB4251_18315 [Vibrio lentus]|uniref:Type III secretion protein n=1 Tax=Vibrio lentus TaxID=136468 RepID=A0AB36XQ95_9VIBR|nr:hypothetical protein [Vibrio lentus]MCC4839228.1 hypothetical protein [Vibrio lentus]PMI13232.1 hypothetical protein BCU51_22595 [Vibrio lentus]PMK31805.1 hypothetical protein BCU02_25275 [Vibrio lentus]PMK48728.1 hypothetical protein BCT99_12145 [Vibrio lentus]PML30632.1 hypothetical protein BCT79_20985 [Vibrio lentus]